jgi:rubrerythrin
MNLYTDLAKLVTDRMAKHLFENLAAEESSHKLFFEKIWDEEVLKDN